MIYVKSILMGLLAVAVTAGVPLMIVCVYFGLRSERLPAGEAIAIDPINIFKSAPAWIIAAVVFAVGFYWEHRRMKLRQRK